VQRKIENLEMRREETSKYDDEKPGLLEDKEKGALALKERKIRRELSKQRRTLNQNT